MCLSTPCRCSGYNSLPPLGAITNAHRRGEAVSAKTRNVAGLSAKGTKHGNQGLRFSRCPGSSIYLLEVAVDGPGCSEGGFLGEDQLVLSRSDGPVGRDFGSQATNIHSKNQHITGTFG